MRWQHNTKPKRFRCEANVWSSWMSLSAGHVHENRDITSDTTLPKPSHGDLNSLKASEASTSPTLLVPTFPCLDSNRG